MIECLAYGLVWDLLLIGFVLGTVYAILRCCK